MGDGDLDQWSRSQVKVNCLKNKTIGNISDTISPIAFILDTKVQPNDAYLMTQLTVALAEGQGKKNLRSCPKIEELAISLMIFQPTTSSWPWCQGTIH